VHTLFGYWIADLLVRWLPARASRGLAVGLARVTFALRPPARAALEANLERLSPERTAAGRRRLARDAFEHFAVSLVEFLRLHRVPPERLAGSVEVHGHCHLKAARRAGRGVIVMSAHAGSWECGAAWLASRGIRLHVVARPHRHPWVERLFVRRRAQRGVGTIPERPVWTRAARLLRAGEWVAVMGDRTEQGQPAVREWAAALARRTGALRLPALMLRRPDGHYCVHFGAPLSPGADATDADHDALLPLLRLAPSQWMAFEALPAGWA